MSALSKASFAHKHCAKCILDGRSHLLLIANQLQLTLVQNLHMHQIHNQQLTWHTKVVPKAYLMAASTSCS
jgi:hypothetical protein